MSESAPRADDPYGAGGQDGRRRLLLGHGVDSAPVAADTRVCAYDRAGRGWSEPADNPQDATQIAADLHTLLQRWHVPGPYVLAGHSFGGLYVLTDAHQYPDEVAGMVLIDATNPATEADSAKATAYDNGSYEAVTDRVAALGAAAARVGLVRLVGSFGYGDLPPQARDAGGEDDQRFVADTRPPAGPRCHRRPAQGRRSDEALHRDGATSEVVVVTA